MRFQVAIIPARYESTRFPGKPLVPILGVPMIVRTYRQALKATTLDAVVVATDDERIAVVCREAGARVVMTDPDCPNGAPLPFQHISTTLAPLYISEGGCK